MAKHKHTKDDVLAEIAIDAPPVRFDKNNKVVYDKIEYQTMLVASPVKEKVFQLFSNLPQLLQDGIRSNELHAQLLVALAHQQEQILALQVELKRLQHGMVAAQINQQITDTVNKAIESGTTLDNSSITVKISAAITASGEKTHEAKSLDSLNCGALNNAKAGLKAALEKLASLNVDYSAERAQASEAIDSLEQVERATSRESFELTIEQRWNTRPATSAASTLAQASKLKHE